eukprot:2821233-Ditylum_brightwellii.AAC.1
MVMKVYSMDYRLPNNNPIGGHLASLKYYEKATSFFMPNQHMQWNKLTKVGNSTRSDYFNERE